MRRSSMWMLLIIVVLGGLLLLGCKEQGTVEDTGMVATGAQDSAVIAWEASLETAQETAQAAGKPILADFYLETCGWCKKLDDETFTDQNVISLVNARFVPVKVNGSEHSSLTGKYGIGGFPTIIVADAQGEELGRIIGFRAAGDFQKELLAILESQK